MKIEEIGDRYYRKIYKLALFHLKNGEEAEDLTQDIFLKIFQKIDTFAGRSAPYTWIYRLAINAIINHIKRENILRFISFQNMPEGFESLESGDPEGDPARRMELDEIQKDRLRLLERAIGRMSLREKTAFYLFHYENIKQREIAVILKTTVPAVESLIHKAKRKVLGLSIRP